MASLIGYARTRAGKRRVKAATRTWVKVLIASAVVLALVAVAALASMGLVASRANHQGQALKDSTGQIADVTTNAADSFTQAVGCQADPGANQCSADDVTTAGNDLSAMASHVTVTTPDGTTTEADASTITSTITSLGCAMPTAWEAADGQATGKIDGHRWTLTFDGQTLTRITITQEDSQ